jgi:hypothetical protein
MAQAKNKLEGILKGRGRGNVDAVKDAYAATSFVGCVDWMKDNFRMKYAESHLEMMSS